MALAAARAIKNAHEFVEPKSKKSTTSTAVAHHNVRLFHPPNKSRIYSAHSESSESKNVLALRGGPAEWRRVQSDIPAALSIPSELVRFIPRARRVFASGSAGFPEGHIACKTGKHADVAHS
jgi:5,10-methylenetetrahydrofolate reductase